MYWSIAAEEATKKMMLAFFRRPARPACCQALAIVPGYPHSTQASSAPISIPSSRAFVEITASTFPARSPR